MRRLSLLASFLCVLLSYSALAQQKYSVKQLVEVQWNGRWYKANVLEVKGDTYKIHYDGYASSWDETVPASRIRLLNEDKAAKSPEVKLKAGIQYGKYGCTVSKYSGGQYTYIPKGSFQLKKDGTYVYNGFSKPSTGTFSSDASGVISFKQGYFNGGQATPIQGYENRYYLVFPTIPDGRWTCSFVSAE